jgi:hypothetical protein
VADAQRRANPVPIGGPDSPRHQFRTLRQNPENALLNDTEFDRKYGLSNQTTVQILGPQSGERNAGIRSVTEAIRNNILAKGGPDIGFNPKGDLDLRRKLLMLLPADPAAPPDPTTAAGKSIQAERDAQRRAYPVPIGGPDSPRHQFRTLRLNPENARLNDTQFEKKYGLPDQTTVQILGPQSGERNAGIRSVTEATRNHILANGGPDIGINPKGDLDLRRKFLKLIPDPRAVAEEADKAPGIDSRQAYPVPIGGPDSPRHQFRILRQNPENALLNDSQFEKKYGLPNRTTVKILGPQSGERKAGMLGVSKEARNSILANGGPDIGFTRWGSLDRRRKALIAAAAAAAPRAEAAAQNPVLGARASSASPDSPQRGAGEGPAKRPRLETGLQNEPSLSDPFMAYQDPFAGQYRHDEPGTSHSFMAYQDPFAGQYRHDEPGTSHPFMPYQAPQVEPIVQSPYRTESGAVPLRPLNRAENPETRLVSPPSPDNRPLPPFRESPGSGDRPAVAPQGGDRRSPSPDPEQDFMDAILRSFQDY